uniref:Uncharacterized protein n=1 Tax=Lotharella globosa TaxID=91324 RepID=A0A7S3YRY8_9EUKA|mmetsp:Transcript_31440/g.60640  ORF Transcript_31440/g.60640 Transcript_31440/m.60640 type:complete len:241 (+) Transcript_31440:66-788(+)
MEDRVSDLEDPSGIPLLGAPDPSLVSRKLRETDTCKEMRGGLYNSTEFPFQEETMQEDDPYEDIVLAFSYAGSTEHENLLGTPKTGNQQELNGFLPGAGQNSGAWCCQAIKDCTWCCLYPFVTRACCAEACRKSCDECDFRGLYPLLFVAPFKNFIDYERWRICWVSSEDESWVKAYSSAYVTTLQIPLWTCCCAEDGCKLCCGAACSNIACDGLECMWDWILCRTSKNKRRHERYFSES